MQVHKWFKWHHFQLIEIVRPKKEFKEGIFWKTVTLNKKFNCPSRFLEEEGHSQPNLENDVAFCGLANNPCHHKTSLLLPPSKNQHCEFLNELIGSFVCRGGVLQIAAELQLASRARVGNCNCSCCWTQCCQFNTESDILKGFNTESGVF